MKVRRHAVERCVLSGCMAGSCMHARTGPYILCALRAEVIIIIQAKHLLAASAPIRATWSFTGMGHLQDEILGHEATIHQASQQAEQAEQESAR